MSHLKKTLKWVVNIFTFILLFILILVIYGKAVLTFTDNMYPNYFGYTMFEVASGSMEPALQVNDVILVKVNDNNLKLGDIIAFRNEDAIITHRIVYMEGDILTVKGDHNNTIDKPINKSQVIGKVIKVYSKLGIWKKVVTNPKILILLFVTLVLFDVALSYNGKKDNPLKKKETPKKVISDKANDETKNDKKEEVLFKEITNDKVEKKKKNVTESDKLLELTRKIDIEEIKKLLDGNEEISNDVPVEKEEISDKKEETAEKKEETTEKKKVSDDYTMRLDLNEIQRKIDEKVR